MISFTIKGSLAGLNELIAANYNDKKRVKRLKIDYQMKLTNKKTEYDDTQLNLF